MSRVIWHVTMSLDGFVAGPDDSMDWVVQSWAEDGEDERDIDPASSAMADAVLQSVGAILAGRRWYDIATNELQGVEGIYGGEWTGSVFVLTHHPPEGPHHPAITFVSGTLEEAVAAAREAAGEGNVVLFGANLPQQCLDAGLLDEIVIHLAPVLLGDGVRLYDVAGGRTVPLERVEVAAPGRITDLRFRVPG